MAFTLFVSEEYLKKYTPLGGLVEWTEIEPSVHIAQDSFILDILGTNFYDHIQLAYSGQTLIVDEIQLMNRIKPALAYRVADQSITFIHYQIKNKGVQSQSGDYSQPVGLEEFKYLRNELRNRAEFYSKRLSNYLCENRDLFVQYTVDNTTDMKPKSSGYDHGGLSGLAIY